MDINGIPNEMVKIIISLVSIEDAKNIALTSKRMYQLSLSRIWNRLRMRKISLYFLLKNLHQPIQELHTCDFDFHIQDKQCWPVLQKLKVLYIDHGDAIRVSSL